MFFVKVDLLRSPIHGLGCFAAEKIRKNQEVWVFNPHIDRRIPYDSLDLLPAAAREFLELYGYVEIVEGQKVMNLNGDLARHMNHSTNPNVVTTADPEIFIAAHDIAVGQELTCNYYDFSLEFADKIGKPGHWGFTG